MSRRKTKIVSDAEFITSILEQFDLGKTTRDFIIEDLRLQLLDCFLEKILDSDDNYENIATKIKKIYESENVKRKFPELGFVVKKIGTPTDKEHLALFYTMFMDRILLGWIQKLYPRIDKQMIMGALILGLIHYGSSAIQAQIATAKWYGEKSITGARNAYYYARNASFDHKYYLSRAYPIFTEGPKKPFLSDNPKTLTAFNQLKKACLKRHELEEKRSKTKKIVHL